MKLYSISATGHRVRLSVSYLYEMVDSQGEAHIYSRKIDSQDEEKFYCPSMRTIFAVTASQLRRQLRHSYEEEGLCRRRSVAERCSSSKRVFPAAKPLFVGMRSLTLRKQGPVS